MQMKSPNIAQNEKLPQRNKKKILVPNEDLLICGSTLKEYAHTPEILSNQFFSITLVIDGFFKEKRSFFQKQPPL